MTVSLDYDISHGPHQVPMITVAALFYLTAVLLIVRGVYRVADGSRTTSSLALQSAVTFYVLVRASVTMYFGISCRIKNIWHVMATVVYIAVLAYYLHVCARYLNLLREVLRGKSAKILFHVGIAVNLVLVVVITGISVALVAGHDDGRLESTISILDCAACTLSGFLLLVFSFKLFWLTRHNSMAAGDVSLLRDSEHFKPMISAVILGAYSISRSWVLFALFDTNKEHLADTLWISFPMFYLVELFAAWGVLAVLLAPVEMEGQQLLAATIVQGDHLRQMAGRSASGASPVTPRPNRGYPPSPRGLKLAASSETLVSVHTSNRASGASSEPAEVQSINGR